MNAFLPKAATAPRKINTHQRTRKPYRANSGFNSQGRLVRGIITAQYARWQKSGHGDDNWEAELQKNTTTTKDLGLVRQLLQGSQLRLAAEFQRNAVWPRAAKAYLIDTILSERPMPLFFLQRGRSPQTGKPIYTVVDGQQRLRAVFDFIDDRFALTESTDRRWKGKRFSELSSQLQENLLNYDLTVIELTDYDDAEIRDIFVRMNKYVVKLSQQELRHAREHGAFYDYIEILARTPFWREQRVFTKHQLARMRGAEFSAEVVILLQEGVQDKKAALDLYYAQYRRSVPFATDVTRKLSVYLRWLSTALPKFRTSRFRKPTDLYSLLGALDKVSRSGRRLKRIDPRASGAALMRFEQDTETEEPSRKAAAYLRAASRQTDNVGPRSERLEILASLLVVH